MAKIARMTAQELARKTLGLAPVEKPLKREKVRRIPGVVVQRKSKYTIFGYASRGIIHLMGSKGWSLEEARKALNKFCPDTKKGISDANLQYRLRAGTREGVSRPAPLTKEEYQKLCQAAGRKK